MSLYICRRYLVKLLQRLSFNHRQTSTTRMEELRGYLWPLPVYERVKKKKPSKDMPVVTTVYNGRSIKGVMLDETHGRPVGSIAIYGEDVKYVQKDSQSSSVIVLRLCIFQVRQ